MKRSVFGAFALALVALAGAPATTTLAAEVVPGITLPDASTLVGFANAESAAKASAAFTTTRINLEPDEGAWRYRVEGFGIRGERVRVDVNATSGAVIRARRDGGGGNRLSREAAAIRSALSTFTVTFAQAADIATAANTGFFAHDVRLELRGSVIVYTVSLVNATAAREVRINPVGGAITSTQAGDDNGGGGNDDHGGNTGGSNSGGNSGSNSGNGNNPATFPGNLPNQPRAVAAAIGAAIAAKPAGEQMIESRYNRVRNITHFEVVTAAPGSPAGTKTRIDLRTGGIISTEAEQVNPDDTARMAAFNAALGTQTPISASAIVTAGWVTTRGDVLRVEPSTLNGQPIFEVRMQIGNREKTVKVHAVTGAVL